MGYVEVENNFGQLRTGCVQLMPMMIYMLYHDVRGRRRRDGGEKDRLNEKWRDGVMVGLGYGTSLRNSIRQGI